MKEFNSYLSCELYKIYRKKTLLIMAIVILAIILVVMGLSFLLNYIFTSAGVVSVNGDYEYQLAQLRVQLEMIESQMDASFINRLLLKNEKYQILAQISMYEYFVENNVPAGACTPYSLGEVGIGGEYDYYKFTCFAMSSLMTVIICFMIVIACRNTVGEYNNGTMKMQLMRPVNKQKFYTAKWLAVYIVSEAVLLFSMLASFMIGVMAFGGYSADVVIVANASSVIRVSPLAALFISFLMKSVKIFMLLQLTMFINSLSKKMSLALTLNILLSLVEIGVLIETVASLAYVGFAGFFMNINWENALSLTGPSLRGMSLWTMIPISLVWTGLFMGLSYRNFAKKEI